MSENPHLEQMGRELKCPICLSLLNSAVSLTCNHVFCNSCIWKSMKSASKCPVCKVPFQRREVRLAPHMDNLVDIYKSMEVASGVNMFISQAGTVAKLPGDDNKFQGKVVCEIEKNEKVCKGKSIGKKSKKSPRNTSRNSRSNLVKPSFPAKKRVRLETPVRPGKLESGHIELTKDENQSSPVTKGRMHLDENEETVFAPFFWLRNEKDQEKLTQQTDEDNVTGTPPGAPCFSDMKDSDDEKDCDNNPTSVLRSVSRNADIYDSEMFEWTQVPCSPELYSSPTKMQVKETNELDGIQEMEHKGAAEVDWQITGEKGESTSSKRATAEIETVPTVSSYKGNMINIKGKNEKTKTRVGKVNGSTQRKRIKRVTDLVPGIHNISQDGAGEFKTRPLNSCSKTKEHISKNFKDQICSKTVKFSADDNAKVKVIKSNQIAKSNSTKMEKASARLSGMFDASSSVQCAFCQSSEVSNVSGIMVHYSNGKPVAADYNGGLGIIHSHRECAEWAPNVYFEDETAINLEAELSRSRRIKCCCCGVKGAALGCYEKSCRRSFHFPCAKLTPQCRWDNENFVMLCPLHNSLALPSEASGSQLKRKKNFVLERQAHNPQSQVAVSCGISATSHWNSRGLFKKLIISCSALTSKDKETVREFEKLSGVMVLKTWDSSVTHVITSTDENGASKRTLKFLMGILEGKWIVSIEWVNACMKHKEPVGEQDYEIDIDVHGVRYGPRLGRLRISNKQPKLLNGYKFYFTGDFVPSYKGYLNDLIIAAGGTVLLRKPISLDQEFMSMTESKTSSQTILIYSLELPDNCSPNKTSHILKSRQSDAEALAKSTGALAVSNKWILNSIAACKLQNLTD